MALLPRAGGPELTANSSKIDELLSTPVSKPNQTLFDLSHSRKFTANLEHLYPVLCEQLIPGDVAYFSANALLRSLPMVTPSLTSYKTKLHAFFVPNRILWKYWQNFVTGADDYGNLYMNPADQPQLPYISNNVISRVAGCMLLPTASLAVKNDSPYTNAEFCQPSELQWYPVSPENANYNYDKYFGKKSLLYFLGYDITAPANKQIIEQYLGSSPESSPYYDCLTNYRENTNIVRPMEDDDVKFNALPIRAYHYIWDQYYRSENLMNASTAQTDWYYCSGNEHTSSAVETLPNGTTRTISAPAAFPPAISSASNGTRSSYFQNYWYHIVTPSDLTYSDVKHFTNYFGYRPISLARDYFTAQNPWTQKGEPVQVISDSQITKSQNYANDELLLVSSDKKIQILNERGKNVDTTLLGTSSFDINQLRLASAMQQILEKDARAGTRFWEWSLSHFGTAPDDTVLNRPIYLGGTAFNSQLSMVAQTSETTENSPQGNLTANALGQGHLDQIKYYASEYGYIMVLMSIMPEQDYSSYILRDRLWNSRDDLPMPELANIGEQPTKEWEYGPNKTNDDFGYLPVYTYLKARLNTIGGELCSTLRDWAAPINTVPDRVAFHVSTSQDGTGLTFDDHKTVFTLTAANNLLRRVIYNPYSATHYGVTAQFTNTNGLQTYSINAPLNSEYGTFDTNMIAKLTNYSSGDVTTYGDYLENAYNPWTDQTPYSDHFICGVDWDFKVLRSLPKFGLPKLS